MNLGDGTFFDPKTVDLMKTTLDNAWSSLSAEQQTKIDRTSLAERILRAAAQGEREPVWLRAHALISIAQSVRHRVAAREPAS